jgi:hypothetical protein
MCTRSSALYSLPFTRVRAESRLLLALRFPWYLLARLPGVSVVRIACRCGVLVLICDLEPSALLWWCSIVRFSGRC